MEFVDKNIFVNGLMITTDNKRVMINNSITYAPTTVIVGALGLTRRDAFLDVDLQSVHFNKDGIKMIVSNDGITFNGITKESSGCIDLDGSKYLPIKECVELYGGTYSETDVDIDISI